MVHTLSLMELVQMITLVRCNTSRLHLVVLSLLSRRSLLPFLRSQSSRLSLLSRLQISLLQLLPAILLRVVQRQRVAS